MNHRGGGSAQRRRGRAVRGTRAARADRAGRLLGTANLTRWFNASCRRRAGVDANCDPATRTAARRSRHAMGALCQQSGRHAWLIGLACVTCVCHRAGLMTRQSLYTESRQPMQLVLADGSVFDGYVCLPHATRRGYSVDAPRHAGLVAVCGHGEGGRRSGHPPTRAP